MRKLIAGAALALIVTGAGGTAFAGEIGGSTNGKPGRRRPEASRPTRSAPSAASLTAARASRPVRATCRTGATSIAASTPRRGSPATVHTGFLAGGGEEG